MLLDGSVNRCSHGRAQRFTISALRYDNPRLKESVAIDAC